MIPNVNSHKAPSLHLIIYFVVHLNCFVNNCVADVKDGYFTISGDKAISLEQLFEIQPISFLGCGHKCLKNGFCQSFAFDPVLGKCNGFSRIFGTLLVLADSAEYYKLEDPCTDYVVLSILKGNETLYSASSTWPDPIYNYAADRAVLNSKQVGLHRGAWSAHTVDQNQYLQIDMMISRKLKGVVTQGRTSGKYNQWVTKYRVLYSTDCKIWRYAGSSDCRTSRLATERNGKVFDGNTDQNTMVENMFESHAVARCIRINPIEWNEHISMRADAIGCNLPCGVA